MKLGRTLPEAVCDRTELAARLSMIRAELFGEHGLPELARQIGIPVRAWCSYEAGAAVPGEVLLSFLEKTGTNPDWLLSGEGPLYRQRLDPAAAFDRYEKAATGSTQEWRAAGGTEIVLSVPHNGELELEAEVLSPSVEPQWESERGALIDEIPRPQRRPRKASARANSETEVVLAALEEENRKLRRFCEKLQGGQAAELAAACSEVKAIRSQLAEAQSDALFRQDESRHLNQRLDKERQALDQLRQSAKDEIEALRAEGATLRSGLRQAVEDVCRLQASLELTQDSKKSDLTSEERMLAFRQHLQDVHVQEIGERENNRRAWSWISRQLRQITPTIPTRTAWKASGRSRSRALNV
jgi:hypothetical protein